MLYDLRSSKTSVLQHKPAVGDKFLRYFMDDLYSKGEVVEVDSEWITVDFGDTVKRFQCATCTLVFNASNLSHLMTCSDGELVRDYRDNVPQSQTDIDDIEDLLDFAKWMV
jgi:hypothetical protein